MSTQHDRTFLLDNQQEAISNREVRGYDTLGGGQYSVQNLDVAKETTFEAKKLPQYVAALTATLSALAAGAVLGWTSPILNEMEHDKYHNISINDSQMGWIGSFVTVGAMFMCIPTGFICNIIGSQMTLLLLIVPFSVGWSMLIWAKNITVLYFGRIILGTAVGACCVAAPMYTTEIAQKEIRGTLGSYFQLMVTIGIFYAYLLGKFLTPTHYTIACAFIPLVFFAFFIFQPESPLYYLKKEKYEKAKKSLYQLRGINYNVDNELNLMESSLKENRQSTISWMNTFKRKATLKAFLISLSLMFLQQFSGINAVILYTSDIFEASGIKLDPKVASIMVGAFQAVATFISSLIVDRLGRRVLLLSSDFIMAISNVFLGLFFTLKFRHIVDADTIASLGFLPVVSLCLFVVVFSLGLGPIPWMISSEIFTPQVKNIASSIAGSFNWFLAFLVTKFYLDLKNSIGQDSTFYIFAFISFMGTVLIYFVVPETKGKTINEIQQELEE